MRVGIVRLVVAACLGGGLALAPGMVLADSPASGHDSSTVQNSQQSGSPSFYLALGDSLAAGCTGYGADDQYSTNCSEVSIGPGVGAPDGYVADIAGQLGLTLATVDLGCPGETTTSMISGTDCQTSEQSQLTAAEDFLAAAYTAKKSTLVTIDIGANDLLACAPTSSSPTISPTCVANAIATASRNLATILAGLKAADPQAHIVGMNYYDPVLAAWLEGSSGEWLAFESAFYAGTFNQTLDSVYAEFGVPVANVQGAFQTFDFFQYQTLTLPGSTSVSVPQNVYNICTLTYSCLSLGTTNNPHPNTSGYQRIADAFLAAGV